ncbi:MAG: aminotransferase class I/II-fold pyridoxal phosphate-dependent enzyme [Streptomycetaceae bacterium]|nr:aminotransferase class I/II-fold pyridoxal phosphate-dependent enzyme [Streptomycetaceae bacterium]
MTTPPDALAALRAAAAHHEASRERLHLLPSENGLSLAARLPHLTEAAVRYACPGPESGGENCVWPGRQDLVAVEQGAAVLLGAQLGAAYVNLKPVSGISALTVALSALAGAWQTVFNWAERDGGHGSTRFIGTHWGLRMKDLPFDPVTLTLDLDRLADRIGEGPPALVYLDVFTCLFPVVLRGLREVVGEQTAIHYDASHALGLIAGGEFQNPLAEGADSLGGSADKTYPGPHKGLLATNDSAIAARLDEHASHFASHHHSADVAALAVAAAEMDEHGTVYARRTVANARRLAAALAERGFIVCGEHRGFTACHQLWIDIAALMDAQTASRLLFEAGVVVEAIPIPRICAPAGLRLGVQEVSWAEMGTAEMNEFAEVFTAVLRDGQDPATAAKRTRALLEAHRPDSAADQVLRGGLAATGGDRGAS